MNRLSTTLKALTFAFFIMALSSVANAQATRTWVSGVGDDVNPCSRTAPCKTYAGAISKTARDGEISTLDPGGFGAVTITKSITINGTSGQGYGSILASGTTGVVINITDAADTRKTVRLNWLDINGAPSTTPGLTGIRFLAGSVLQVENTVIDSFRSTSLGFGHGIHANLNGNASLVLRNVVVRNCLNSGIRVENAGANVTSIAFNNVQVSNCAIGIEARNGTRGSVRDSMVAINTTGFELAQVGSATEVNIDGTTITGHVTGINVPSGRARISRCLIAQNVTSLTPTANVDTGINNTIVGNTNNNAPTGTQSTEK